MGCHFLLQCVKVNSESEVAQSCPTLCDPMDCSLPGSSVHGIFQARILEWVAITGKGLYLNKLCGTTNFPRSPCVGSLCCSVAKLCPTLHNRMDCSPPGSSVHGIFQSRVLEWGAIAFSGTEALVRVLTYCLYNCLSPAGCRWPRIAR